MRIHEPLTLRFFAGAVLCAAAAAVPARAQSAWPACPNNTAISVTSGGNVGIGTTAPDAPLVVSSAAWNTPSAYITTSNYGGGFGLYNNNSDPNIRNWGIVSNYLNFGDFAIVQSAAWGGNPFAWTGSNIKAYISPAGNVGIGTTAPQYPLSVNGIIQAKEVLVNTGWSDYVFDPRYRLRPLNEVSAYIQSHRHLPDIPSEAEVQAQGVSVGQMQSKLLAKIEELTLHVIHEHDRNDRLERQNRELEERIAAWRPASNLSCGSYELRSSVRPWLPRCSPKTR